MVGEAGSDRGSHMYTRGIMDVACLLQVLYHYIGPLKIINYTFAIHWQELVR